MRAGRQAGPQNPHHANTLELEQPAKTNRQKKSNFFSLQMDRLKEAAKDDPTAWRDYRSPKNRTYWWNEAKNSSGGKGAGWAGLGSVQGEPVQVVLLC